MDVTIRYTNIPKRRESKQYAEHTKHSMSETNPPSQHHDQHYWNSPLRKLPPNIWLSLRHKEGSLLKVETKILIQRPFQPLV